MRHLDLSQSQKGQQDIITFDNNLSYPLITFEGIGNNFEPPGQRALLPANALIDLSKDILVFGERHGGATTFLEWFTDRLKNAEKNFIKVIGFQWQKEFFLSSLSDKKDELHSTIESMIRLTTPAEVVEALDKINKYIDNFESCHFIIHEMPPENARNLAIAFRRFRDANPKVTKLRIMIVNSRETTFLDHAEFSGYLPMCKCHRLARFNQEETEFQTMNLIGVTDKKMFERDVLNMVLDMTGGHPYLIRILSERIKVLLASKQIMISKAIVNRAFRQMMQSPPEGPRLWLEDLSVILKDNPQLVDRLRIYLAGHTFGEDRFPPPLIERRLFVAGWLGLNQRGRWGITSQFHARLARQALTLEVSS